MSNTSRLSSTVDSASGSSPPAVSSTSTRVSSQTSSENLVTALSGASSREISSARGSLSNPRGDTALITSNSGRSTVPLTNDERTSTSVVVVHTLQKSIVFTTIRNSAESTLRVPSSISATNSIDGLVSSTASSLITILSTSTQVNPDSVSGFLENQGQVAGVFTVVGVIASALIAALFWFIRRCRRQQRRKAWFDSLRQYSPPSAEVLRQEPHDARFIRSVQTTSGGISEPHIYSGTGYHTRSKHHSADESVNQELTGFETVSSSDPFHDPLQTRQITAINVSRNREELARPSDMSPAPSSPSIHPESLPPIDDKSSLVKSELSAKLRTLPEPLLHRSLSTGQARTHPRPPRLYLREPQNPIDFIPLTPPSSHGHSQLSTPEIHSPGTPEPFTPRTWLNARPLSAPEPLTLRISRGSFVRK